MPFKLDLDLDSRAYAQGKVELNTRIWTYNEYITNCQAISFFSIIIHVINWGCFCKSIVYMWFLLSELNWVEWILFPTYSVSSWCSWCFSFHSVQRVFNPSLELLWICSWYQSHLIVTCAILYDYCWKEVSLMFPRMCLWRMVHTQVSIVHRLLVC